MLSSSVLVLVGVLFTDPITVAVTLLIDATFDGVISTAPVLGNVIVRFFVVSLLLIRRFLLKVAAVTTTAAAAAASDDDDYDAVVVNFSVAMAQTVDEVVIAVTFVTVSASDVAGVVANTKASSFTL